MQNCPEQARGVHGGVPPDVSLEERVKYSYDLRPLELVYLPRLRDLGESRPAYAAIHSCQC